MNLVFVCIISKDDVFWTLDTKELRWYRSFCPEKTSAGFDPMKYGTGPVKDDDDEAMNFHAVRWDGGINWLIWWEWKFEGSTSVFVF